MATKGFRLVFFEEIEIGQGEGKEKNEGKSRKGFRAIENLNRRVVIRTPTT